MSKSLAGRNALITGGNRGVGKELVRKFAAEGANVIFNTPAQNSKAEEFAKEVAAANGVQVIYVPCDITNEQDIENMVNVGKEKLKKIDILVNSEERTCFGEIETMKVADFRNSIKANLTAPFLFCQKCLPMMKEQKWGRIINITSGATQIIQPQLGAYTAGKIGVNSLTKVIAKEVGEFKITVNAVVPGFVDASMDDDQSANMDGMKDQITGVQVFKETLPPKSLAEMSAFLASESAAGMTGGMYPVDNGLTC